MKGKPLSETHPELAAEAVGWDPATVSRGTDRRLTWRCAKGHLWDAPPYSRVSGSGCPVCAEKVAMAGVNDMATTHRLMAAEAHGWDPTKFIAGTGRKLFWKCAQGHVWQATGNSRVTQNSGCPFCANQKVQAGYNDLLAKFPTIAAEADGWDPSTVVYGSGKRLSWKCQFGHRWMDSVSNRTRAGGMGCSVCSGRKVLTGFNDFATVHPDLAAQADGWDPTRVIRSSNRKLAWRCSHGHQWITAISSRISGSGCPTCAGQRSIPGVNDLKTVNPSLAAEAEGWDPSTVLPLSNTRHQWKRSLGHQWQATVANRTSGYGCPYCSGNKVLSGFNDLATTDASVAAEADGWDPTTVSRGSITKRQWRCPLGHSYEATPNNRTSGLGKGCPICSGKKVLVGFNDLRSRFPDVAADADGWDPESITSGSNKKMNWRCENGHTWSALVSSRTLAGTGCPSCAKYGFNPGEPGWLYFLRHPYWGLLQIGITNDSERRVRRHQSRGWELVEPPRGPMDGAVTYQWEQSILRALRKRNVDLGPENVAGRFDGYTESWIEEELPARSTRELMDFVYQDEEENSIQNHESRSN